MTTSSGPAPPCIWPSPVRSAAGTRGRERCWTRRSPCVASAHTSRGFRSPRSTSSGAWSRSTRRMQPSPGPSWSRPSRCRPRATRGDLSRRALAYAGLATAAQLVGDGDAARAAANRAGTFAAEPSLSQIPLLQATVLEAKGTSLCRSGQAQRGGAAAGARRGERGGAVLAREPAAGEGVAAPCRVPGSARAHR